MGLPSLESGWERLIQALADIAPRSERIEASVALGRVLAEEVVADRDVPAQDVSAMDGYAFGASAAATLSAGGPVDVDGVLAAGAPATPLPLAEGRTRRIMTGAVLPPGADRVLPFEATDRGRERVRRIDLAAAPLPSGSNVRPRGEVARAGDRLLEVGRRIGPPELAVAASAGITRLSTIAGLTAAIVVTGDEVVGPEATPTASEVRDSHGAFLLAECGAAGVAVEHLGIVRDDPEALERVLRRGLAHDLLVVTGGVSAGEFDFVEPILARLGAQVVFEGLAIQPGKPVVTARLDRTVILGLPGNPASAMVVWWLVGRALVRRLSGEPDVTPWQGATWLDLGAPAPGAGTRDRFLPAHLSIERGRRIATPIPARGSHDLFAHARADVLLRVRAGDSARATGSLIEAIDLRVVGF